MSAVIGGSLFPCKHLFIMFFQPNFPRLNPRILSQLGQEYNISCLRIPAPFLSVFTVSRETSDSQNGHFPIIMLIESGDKNILRE